MSRVNREYTLLRSDQSSQVKGWIHGNTKIGPVLDVMVCYHQGRYGIEIMIGSLFGDKTCSWVRIVNGINKYVTEMSEETHVESIGEEYRETCCEDMTTTDVKFNVVSCVYSVP